MHPGERKNDDPTDVVVFLAGHFGPLLLDTPPPGRRKETEKEKEKQKVVAYVPNWVDLESFSETIDYAKVTHINVAFENPDDEQGDLSFHKNDDLLIAKAHATGVKVLVSIGGGAAASNKALKARYFDLIADAKRPDFVAKLAAYRRRPPLRRPRRRHRGPVDQRRLRRLHRRPGRRAQARGQAPDRGPVAGVRRQERPRLRVRALRLRQRDGLRRRGPVEPEGAGPARVHGPRQTERRVLGEPRAPRRRSSCSASRSTATASARPSASAAIRIRPSSPRTPAPSDSDQAGETIWYNGIPTIEAKTNYAIDRGLAGIMIWSLDDDAHGEKSLLDAIARTYDRASPK